MTNWKNIRWAAFPAAFLASLDGLIWFGSRGLCADNVVSTMSGVKVPDSAARSKTFLPVYGGSCAGLLQSHWYKKLNFWWSCQLVLEAYVICQSLLSSKIGGLKSCQNCVQAAISGCPQFRVLLLQMFEHDHAELLQGLYCTASVPAKTPESCIIEHRVRSFSPYHWKPNPQGQSRSSFSLSLPIKILNPSNFDTNINLPIVWGSRIPPPCTRTSPKGSQPTLRSA